MEGRQGFREGDSKGSSREEEGQPDWDVRVRCVSIALHLALIE
jgi:hypothetical protein